MLTVEVVPPTTDVGVTVAVTWLAASTSSGAEALVPLAVAMTFPVVTVDVPLVWTLLGKLADVEPAGIVTVGVALKNTFAFVVERVTT
jgi:hypothetical protein